MRVSRSQLRELLHRRQQRNRATLTIFTYLTGLILFLPGLGLAEDPFASNRVWTLQIAVTETELAAIQPSMPQYAPFDQPQIPGTVPAQVDGRETVPNLLGTRFPWIQGRLKIAHADSDGRVSAAMPCRLRYDGDFTYMLSAMHPKRPLYIQLLDGHDIGGATAFRLHPMQFDASMIREKMATELYQMLNVPTPRAVHMEVSWNVEAEGLRSLGLYTALEAVERPFIKRIGFDGEAFVAQLMGLQTLQFMGESYAAYAPLFGSPNEPTDDQQQRIIDFTHLISHSNDNQFRDTIEEFVDAQSVLRYLAAIALTSNVVGFSNVGVNDNLCLEPATGRFSFVANEFETAFGNAMLSGTPEQLSALSIYHPYAGACPLIDRMMGIPDFRKQYDAILLEALNDSCKLELLTNRITELEAAVAPARARDAEVARERTQAMAPSAIQGFNTAELGDKAVPRWSLTQFVSRRYAAVRKQLNGEEPGYTPAASNAGVGVQGGFPPIGFAPGGLSPGISSDHQGPISEEGFRLAVKVPDEFDVALFAHSPEVNYPVAIAAEPSGAIYVASDEQGSLGTARNAAKLLRCVDANGDGQVDAVSTFCRVDHIRGVVYRSGKVWVCHPPFLSVFEDLDGDGVADRKQQLVSGLTTEMVNTRGGDHTTNGIRFGIDGWLYIGDGDYGVPDATGVDGSRVVLRGGGILRVRPDGTELELFASGLRNPFDIAIDPWLNMFTRDNTNDGGGWDTRVSQLHQTAEYGYPRLFANFSDEIMPALGSFGNGGGTGALFIEHPAWPARWNNSLFTSDWGRSGVFHHAMSPAGPTFRISQERFADVPRATGMDMDADGNLYVASWWRGEASVYVGPHVGFVTRITPKNAPRQSSPDLKKLETAELIELLRTPQSVLRFHVQGELLHRGNSVDCLTQLLEVVRNPRFPTRGRIVALFAVKQLQGEDSHPLLLELAKRDSTIREFAIRALGDRKSQLSNVDATQLARFLDDPSPRVQAQTLITLSRLGNASIAEQIIPLAAMPGSDRPDPAQPYPELVIPHLALRALIELQATEACLQALEGPHQLAALRALRSMHSPQVVDGLLHRMNDERFSSIRNEILGTLMRLYHQERPYDSSWWGIRPDTTGPYYDAVTWSESEQIERALITAVSNATPADATWLRNELARHQIRIPELQIAEYTDEAIPPSGILIEPVDPSNPNQIGNMSYNQIVTRIQLLHGNAAAGKLLFQGRSCSACHTARAGEQPVGPHLQEIGKRYPLPELIESLLKPSEKIAQGFETQAFLLTNGKIISGFVSSESGRAVIVRDSNGASHEIPRDAIDDRTRQTTSSMPEGLLANLTLESLADLIAYLQSL